MAISTGQPLQFYMVDFENYRGKILFYVYLNEFGELEGQNYTSRTAIKWSWRVIILTEHRFASVAK